MEKTVLLLGGDRRQTWLARELEVCGCVETLAVPGLPDTARLRAYDVVILPCPCLDAAGRIRAAGEGLPLSAPEPYLGPGTRVLCGAPRGLSEALKGRCAGVTDLLSDPVVVEENARLTAEAALLLAEQTTERTVRGRRVGVLGFGRIGCWLSKLLLAHGAEVTAAARNPAVRRKAEELGCKACAFAAFSLGQEIVFNTVPAQTLSPEQLEGLAPDCLWVELASAPGGLPQPPTAGLRLLPAGGLPGRILPRSAADVLCAGILRVLQRDGLIDRRRGETD